MNPNLYASRLFVVELPHLQESFVGKLLDVSPRLSAYKPGELVKILQTTLRQSGFLNLQFPKQVHRTHTYTHRYLTQVWFVLVGRSSVHQRPSLSRQESLTTTCVSPLAWWWR